MFKQRVPHLAVCSIPLVLAAQAFAGDYYVAATIGTSSQDSATNRGRFTSDFVTGEVTGVSPPLTILAGEAVGWSTEFDRGTSYSLVFGWDLEAVRLELEYARVDTDVDTHRGVSAAGIDLTGIDAGVLISGNVGDLGVSVGELVADGRGSLDTSTLYLNGFYDVDLNSSFTPYLGIGIGYGEVEVDYRPSGVGVISADDDVFVYQLIGGVGCRLSEPVDLFINARYLDGADAELRSSLLPADFEIDNSRWVFDVGVRYSF